MKSRLLVGVFALTGLIAWSAALGFGEDDPKPAKPMTEQEMWARSTELAKPGDMHKLVGYFAGQWKINGKMFTSMGEIPFEGQSENKWVLGNRFVATKYEGPGMAGKMMGRGLFGYDNGKKEFQQTWAMTMGTGISFTTGAYDADKKTYTFKGKVLGPDRITYRTRETIEVKGPDEYVATSYATPEKEGAKERMEMQMTCARVKGG